MLKKKSSAVTDMTQGNIASNIIMFALPLLVGNLFQQLYNTVDTWVVGNFVSNEDIDIIVEAMGGEGTLFRVK